MFSTAIPYFLDMSLKNIAGYPFSTISFLPKTSFLLLKFILNISTSLTVAIPQID